ncbi:MAG: hypothetical protein MZU84_03805 [Sphingobacterium sp.]|nr:hypothetical protein [Sphingobacterium sp.]
MQKKKGFKSTRKSLEEKEGKLLEGLKSTTNMLKEKNYLTVGQMFAIEYQNDTPKRNKADNYNNSIPRELLQEEVKIIFEKQREFNNEIATNELENAYSEIAFHQRGLASVEEMVGECVLLKLTKKELQTKL